MDLLSEVKIGIADPPPDSFASGKPVLQGVIERYEPVKKGLKTIKSNVENLKKVMSQDRKCAIPEQMKTNMSKMNKIMDDTKTIAQQVKKVLSGIKADDDEFAEEAEDKNKNQVEMRTNLYNSTARDFHDIMNDYSSCCKDARKDLKDRTRRRLHIVSNQELSEQQVEELLDDPERAEQVIKQAIVGDSIKSLVNEVNQRQDQMKNLERQITEVFEMFKDLSVLIDLQGEHIEVISTHVSNANQAIVEANEELKKAQVHQKSASKYKCYLILFLLVILAILVVVLWGTGTFSNL